MADETEKEPELDAMYCPNCGNKTWHVRPSQMVVCERCGRPSHRIVTEEKK